jgi:hypothetical protein
MVGKTISYRKGHDLMFSTITAVMLILSLVFGGGAVTVHAAQASQPDELLYPIKLASEDIRLGLTSDPAAQSALAMQFASQRVEEMHAQMAAGTLPGAAVQMRYQSQVEQAIHAALGLPADQIPAALEQVRTRLETQQQTLGQVQGSGAAGLVQAQQMLQQRLQNLGAGVAGSNAQGIRLQDPQRDQQRDQDRLRTGTPAAPEARVLDSSAGNPWSEGTPTPGSGYGPGPGTGTCTGCTPQVNSGANNPWTEETPIPGSGYGPGPGLGAQSTCTPGTGPQQPQQYGQESQPAQPKNPGAGSQQPGGSGGPGGKH